jgi:S1-C subfamily serine protease
VPIPDDQNTQKPQKSDYLKGFVVATMIFGVITVIFFSKNTPPDSHSSAPNTAMTTEESEQLIQGSVVHIDCPLADGSGDQLGSGTIINSEGLVLTNAHVIP